jgi:hypothetical protein
MMCGRDEEPWPNVVACWRIVIICAHYKAMDTHVNSKKQTSKGQKKTTITCDSGLCISDKKWIKTKMKTPIRLNSKGNEVIAWCLLSVWSCLFLNNHHCYMCYCHRCSIHHIYANWVSNDDVHQSLKVVYDDKNIHLLSDVVREKVGDLPANMCSIF